MSVEHTGWNEPAAQRARRAHQRLCDVSMRAIDWNGTIEQVNGIVSISANWKDKNGTQFTLDQMHQTDPKNPDKPYTEYELTRIAKMGVEEYFFFTTKEPLITRTDMDGELHEGNEATQVALAIKVGRWIRSCPRPDWVNSKLMTDFNDIVTRLNEEE